VKKCEEKYAGYHRSDSKCVLWSIPELNNGVSTLKELFNINITIITVHIITLTKECIRTDTRVSPVFLERNRLFFCH